MKKLVLVLLIGLFISAVAFADHPGTGIGAIFGGGLGGWDSGWVGYFYPGFSLKVSSIPIMWGLYAYPGYHQMGFGVTGDFYIFDKEMIRDTATNEDGSYNVKIDWYLGVGGYLNTQFWEGRKKNTLEGGARFGIRVPVGVSWHVIKQFEIALGLAPILGVYVGYDGPWFDWGLPIELALRYWF